MQLCAGGCSDGGAVAVGEESKVAKEEGAPCGDPTGVIRCEATGCNYAVDMGMKLQALIPAVEHAEEADLGSEMPWVAGDFKQTLSTGMEEQVVDESFVLQGKRSQLARKSKDRVNVARGQ